MLNKDANASAIGILKNLGPLGWSHSNDSFTKQHISGVWGGLFPRIIMIGTLTALQWFIYDAVKVAFNMPRPPPPEMPDSMKKKLEMAGKHK